MIKLKSLWIGACIVLLCSCRPEKELYVSTSFHEPATEGLRFIYSEDGIHWDSIAGVWLKPEVGIQKIMRDPSIARSADGTFHLVWTSSWKGDAGFGYACSKDLIHWSEEKFIPVMAHDSTTVNVWAPELFYDDEKDEFMVIWASCVPYRFEKGIEDEFNNHRLYYITTKDFERISETKLYFDPGYSSIDATLVKRAPRDYVLVVKDNTRANRNIKVAFGSSPSGPFGEPSEPITPGFCEGPTVAKVDDEYYIYYDDYNRKIFGAVKTRDFIHFTDETDHICMPDGHKHGTIFKAPASIVSNLLNSQLK